MRVWIENPFDNLPSEGRRPQRYWLMAEAFRAAGHEVTLWTSDFSHATKRRRSCDAPGVVLIPTLPYPKNVCLARVRSHRAYAKAWLRLARQRAAEVGKPDLLVVSVPPLSTGDAAIALKREFGCRLVADIMDAWPETFERLFPRPLRFLAPLALLPLRRAADRIYRSADLVTGVCDAYGPLALGRGAKSYFRAYHGIACGSAAADLPRTPGDTTRLVYIGNLGRGYDLVAPIFAVRADPSLSLDIAGAGDWEPKWRALAASSPRIRFHGYLGEAELDRLLDAAAVGIVPLSDATCVGLPYKLADYAAHGLRTVTSLRGECAAFLERHRAGATYVAGDVESFRRAVAKAKGLKPDLAGARDELDAGKIYSDYVKRVTEEPN